MRSFLFNMMFWTSSTVTALLALPLLPLRSRRPLMTLLQTYTRTVMFLMRHVAGIRVRIEGRDRLPNGPCIIAAKHQSYGDGIVMFSQFYDLAFVTGDHLERFPLMAGILKKAGAIVVNNCGGPDARSRLLAEDLALAKAEGRRILIYPEGHLSAVGEQHRYRKGVFYMYADYGCPVVPVATNLGLCWPQQEWEKHPGDAVVEFLDPIPPGLDKETFMARLETAVETRSRALAGIAAATEDARSEAVVA